MTSCQVNLIKTFENEANAPLITKITLCKPKHKDLKNIIWQNSSSNLFNRECTRMVLGVTQRFLRLRKKISDFDVKKFRKNRQRNYLVTPNLQSSTIPTCSLKSRFLKIDFEC